MSANTRSVADLPPLGAATDADDRVLLYDVSAGVLKYRTRDEWLSDIGGGTWLFGTGAPSAGLGVDTNLYFDDDGKAVYSKSAGVWTLRADLEGPQGPQGIQGADGTSAVLGTWRVDWEAGSYDANDVVRHDGKIWMANTTTTEEPTGTPSDWDTLLEDGAQGPQGIQGEQGIQGIQGIQGEQGIQGASGANSVREEVATDTYELVAADDNKHKEFNNVNGVVVFIPENADVPLPVGFEVDLHRKDGAVVIEPLGTATYEGVSNTVSPQNGVVRLKQLEIDRWLGWGDLSDTDTPSTTLAWDGGEPTVTEGDQPTLAWTGSWTGRTPLARSRLVYTTGAPATGWDVSDDPWSAQMLGAMQIPGMEVELQAEYEDIDGNTIITEAIISFTVQEEVVVEAFVSDVITQAIPASIGTQDFVSTKFDADNPVKAVLVIGSGAPALDTANAPARFSFGAVVGATERSAALSLRDAVTGSTTRVSGHNIGAHHIATANSTIVVAGSASILNDNTVRIDWTTVAGEFQTTVVMIGGANAEAVGAASWLQANNGTSDVDFGVTDPDALIVLSGDQTFDGTVGFTTQYSVGLAARTGAGGIEQSCLNFVDGNAENPTIPRASIRDDMILSRLRKGNNGSEVDVALTAWNNGSGLMTFTGTPGVGADDVPMAALAIKLTSPAHAAVVDFDTPTSATDKVVSGFTDTPVLVLQLMSMLTSRNTVVQSDEAGSFGIAAIIGDASASTSFQTESGVATTNTQSLVSETPMALDSDDGTPAFRGTFGGFNSGSYTLTATTADGAARKWSALVISQPDE